MTRQRLAAEQEESRKRQLELERRTQAENEVATASETAKQKSNANQKGKLVMSLPPLFHLLEIQVAIELMIAVKVAILGSSQG